MFREVIAGREKFRGPNHIETTATYIGYAAMLLDQGRVAELIPIMPKITEPLKSHPESAASSSATRWPHSRKESASRAWPPALTEAA
ncbi:MAG: hypothetical protein U0792_15165 [Gemmataceae bacterium]